MEEILALWRKENLYQDSREYIIDRPCLKQKQIWVFSSHCDKNKNQIIVGLEIRVVVFALDKSLRSCAAHKHTDPIGNWLDSACPACPMPCVPSLVGNNLQHINWVWWHTPVIPLFRGRRQVDQKFKASLGQRSCLKNFSQFMCII